MQIHDVVYTQHIHRNKDWKCVIYYTQADPNQTDPHKEKFLWSHQSYSVDSNHLSFQSSISTISTFVQLYEIHINVFHLQSPEFFEIRMFSRTSCSSPDASERPQHQQLHKPQSPAGHTAEVGRPSSQWGVCFENFPLDHQYCLFCGRRHVNMTSNWMKNPSANCNHTSAV